MPKNGNDPIVKRRKERGRKKPCPKFSDDQIAKDLYARWKNKYRQRREYNLKK